MRYDTNALALMGVLIALNIVVGGFVHLIKLPVYLDAIGTILAALLLGLLPGIIVGVLSFLIAAAVLNPVYIYFIVTQALIAIFCYFLASQVAAFKTWRRGVLTGIGLGVVAGVASAPVIVLVFGGVAGSGRDILTALLVQSGDRVLEAVFLSGAASEPFDKTLQVIIAFFILKSLPSQVLEKFRNQVLEVNGLIRPKPNL